MSHLFGILNLVYWKLFVIWFLVLGIYTEEVLMPVLIKKDGPVTIITLSRPEVRNAVDRETAQELADAFRAFDSDASARVAVLSGDQGHFCTADISNRDTGIFSQFPYYLDQFLATFFSEWWHPAAS